MKENVSADNPESKIILPELESHPREKEEDVGELIARDREVREESLNYKKNKAKLELAELKKKMDELGELYDREVEATERALKHSQWEEAKKKYREMEEALDLGYSEKEIERERMAELAELKKKMDELGELYDREVEATERALKHSQWEEAKKKYREMEEILDSDLSKKNTRIEKPTDNLEDPETPLPNPEDPTSAPITPEPPIVLGPDMVPEPNIPKPVEPGEIKRVAIVDAEAQVELMARSRGAERFNQKLNMDGRLKKIWTHMWEAGYRQQYINEERKKILGQENRPGLIRRAMFGASSFDATGKKNLFAGTENEDRNKEELGNIATRFAEDLQRESEGELKRQLDDPEFNTKINDLVYEFASGSMTEDEFELKKNALIDEISQKYPESFAQGGLTADNILEAAKNFRIIYEHNKALARVDVNLEIDLGIAKQAIKTKANLNWVDAIVSVSQWFGPGLSPEAVGFGVAIGSFCSRRPLYYLGGAAGLGGLMGAMRRNAEQKKDLEMHRIGRAMGSNKPGPEAPRREAVEKFVYDMRPSVDIINEVNNLSEAFIAEPSPASASALTGALAEAEARLSLSETRQGDLISFSGETHLEKCRLDLMRTLAKAKIALRDGGFESDMLKTNEYQDKLALLGSQMDKVNKDERFNRWTENGKAAVTGAIGGLVVGGFFQEVAALAGDYFQISWLRPGGRATSVERLYHYIKGDLPTTPTGAGMVEVLGLTASNGVIHIDGTTELIPDPSTGLMALVDKADPSNILAKVSVDATGHITPVPGSYDPNLISFSESKVTGGLKSLHEWISSMKGKFGSNVFEDIWHTKGYLDNDTLLPKVDFNELKLYMGFDKNGNLTIDASKLQEYLQNLWGGQIQGSKHGSNILDVAGEFAKGNIKIGLVPDGANPTSILELKHDLATHKFVSGIGSKITNFFEADIKGQPALKGDGVLGIVHQIGTNPDGSKNIEWINAIRGNGHPIETIESDRIVTEISRKNETLWWGLWAWIYGRKPLEEENSKNEGLIDIRGNYPEIKPGDIEGHGDDDKDIKGVRIKKVTVDTRGQKIENLDTKDWGVNYPEKFPLADEKEMAEYLINQGNFLMSPKDRDQYIALSGADRARFLIERIKKDREFLEIADGKGLTKEAIQNIVDIVMEQTDKIFSVYGEKGRSLLPLKDKIHIVGALEYQAQVRSAHEYSLGVNFLHSGEIFVNFDAIKYRLFKNGKVDINIFISQLKQTIAHEITHGAVANNYWMFETDSGDMVPIQRRTGIMSRRHQIRPGQTPGNVYEKVIIERGRALNEAVTEVLAKKIREAIYKEEGEKPPQNIAQPYSPEINILEMLTKKFGIDFDVFAKAVVDRRAFRKLAEEIDGKSLEISTENNNTVREIEVKRPQFMSLLLSIMDFEFMNKTHSYPTTKKLIEGKKGIVITGKMKKMFASNLLDSTGNIKQSLINKYGLIDEDSELRTPVAA